MVLQAASPLHQIHTLAHGSDGTITDEENTFLTHFTHEYRGKVGLSGSCARTSQTMMNILNSPHNRATFFFKKFQMLIQYAGP